MSQRRILGPFLWNLAVPMLVLVRRQCVEHFLPLGVADLPCKTNLVQTRAFRRVELIAVTPLRNHPLTQHWIFWPTGGDVAIAVALFVSNQCREYFFPLVVEDFPNETDLFQALDPLLR